jgi:hypothetical protein
MNNAKHTWWAGWGGIVSWNATIAPVVHATPLCAGLFADQTLFPTVTTITTHTRKETQHSDRRSLRFRERHDNQFSLQGLAVREP